MLNVKKVAVASGALLLLLGNPAHADLEKVAANFPIEIVPVSAGKIEFWAKLEGEGYTGPLVGSGQILAMFATGTPLGPVQGTWMMAFNTNDGSGNGGLTAAAGSTYFTGTSTSQAFTYEQLLGPGVSDWHQYTLKWNENGLPNPSGNIEVNRKVEVYLDGVLNSTRIFPRSPEVFRQLPPAYTIDLITTQLSTVMDKVWLDEFKIFDGSDNLVFYNTLDSAADIQNSAVGLGGIFVGDYKAGFRPGLVGNALVTGVPEPEAWALMLTGLGLVALAARRKRTPEHRGEVAE